MLQSMDVIETYQNKDGQSLTVIQGYDLEKKTKQWIQNLQPVQGT